MKLENKIHRNSNEEKTTSAAHACPLKGKKEDIHIEWFDLRLMESQGMEDPNRYADKKYNVS